MRRLLPLCLCSALFLLPAIAAEESAGSVSSLSVAEAADLARSIEPQVQKIRGLPFERSVPVKVVNDAEARVHFQERLDRFWPQEQILAEQRAYIQMGLLPEGTDLLALLFEVLEEQAGGYYDPERETFFMLGDMPKTIVGILMAHELTHALDDQHYGIDSRLGKLTTENDRGLAFSSLLEGSGTLVMSVYMLQETMAGRLSPTDLLELQKTEAGRAEKLLSSPQFVQRSLMAPYVVGQSFLLRGNLMGMVAGFPVDDVNRVFGDPPASTEQILHPEKYWDKAARDDPRAVELPDLSDRLGRGWELAGSGDLGELILGILAGVEPVDMGSLSAGDLSSWTNEAAAGWGGDRWQLYTRGADTFTVLATVWDSVDDARQFHSALKEPAEPWVSLREDAVVLLAGDVKEKRARSLAGAVLDRIAPRESTP